MYIGMVTLLCMYEPIWVCVYHLTQRSDTVAGGVAAHNGLVCVMQPGEIATGLWPIV
jgi:hypothetical protein